MEGLLSEIDETYLIYNDQEYVVVYNGSFYDVYKKENGLVVEIPSKLKNEILNLFNVSSSFMVESTNFSDIITSNKDLNNESFSIDILEKIESIIPLEYKDTFYNNIKDVQMLVDPNINWFSKEYRKTGFNKYNCNGFYNIYENKVCLFKNKIYKNASRMGVDALSEQLYNKTFSHEFIHVASSWYNKETNEAAVGLDYIPRMGIDNFSNSFLNEGITEYLSHYVSSTKVRLNYYIPLNIATMLFDLIGSESIVYSYFGNLGTKKMEDSLDEIAEKSEFSNISYSTSRSLFPKIQKLSNNTVKSNILASVQNDLLKYLNAKCYLLIEDKEYDHVLKILSSFENNLFDNKKAKKSGLSYFHDDLAKVMENFANIKTYYESEIKKAQDTSR